MSASETILKKNPVYGIKIGEEKVVMLQELGACVNSFKRLGIEIKLL